MISSKDIFALRKQGRQAEALELARRGHAEQPHDEWIGKAYGWTLYDHLKMALDAGKADEARALAEEVAALHISPEDKMLHENLHRLLEMMKPGGSQFQQAKRLDKEGRHAEALDLFRQAKETFGEQEEFRTSYGWCLFRNLTAALGRTPPEMGKARQLLDTYLETADLKPALLHSQMLRLATKLMEKDSRYFTEVFLRWGPENFMPEDFQKYHWSGKDYPGLAEKSIQQVAKDMLNERDIGVIRSFLPVLDAVMAHATDNIWLPYYKARLLLRLDERDAALDSLMPVVKQKRAEYWAWAALGDIFTALDTDKAVSCFCKAMLCPAEEKFLVNTRFTFGKLLHRLGRDAEAKTELAASLKARLAHDYKVPPELERLTGEDWYLQAKAPASNQSFYEKNKGPAEALLFDELPWLPAVFGAVFSPQNDPGRKLAKLYFTKENKLETLVANDRLLKLGQHFQPGDPLRLKAEEQDGRWQVYLAEERTDGQPWDVLPEQLGVVDYMNVAKQMAHYIVSKTIQGTAPFYRLPKGTAVGSVLSLRLEERERKGQKFLEVLHCERSDKVPPAEVFRVFAGRLKHLPGPGIGFVGDVFVDGVLMKKPEVLALAGRDVAGAAVLSWDEKKQKWGWRAVRVEG